MNATIKLLKILPASLKIAWMLLLLGMLALGAGYFTHTPWRSYLGLLCLILGYVITILDMVRRKRNRADAAGFYFGATVAPLLAVLTLVLVALVGAIVLVIQSMLHGFSGSHALRLLHFLGIVFAFLVVIGIPGLALRSRPDPKPDQDGGEPSAISPSPTDPTRHAPLD